MSADSTGWHSRRDHVAGAHAERRWPPSEIRSAQVFTSQHERLKME